MLVEALAAAPDRSRGRRRSRQGDGTKPTDRHGEPCWDGAGHLLPGDCASRGGGRETFPRGMAPRPKGEGGPTGHGGTVASGGRSAGGGRALGSPDRLRGAPRAIRAPVGGPARSAIPPGVIGGPGEARTAVRSMPRSRAQGGCAQSAVNSAVGVC